MAELRYAPRDTTRGASNCFFGEQQTAEQLKTIANVMVDWGLRYQKLENDLEDPGILLILDTSYAENLSVQYPQASLRMVACFADFVYVVQAVAQEG